MPLGSLVLLLHPREGGRPLTAVYWALCSASVRGTPVAHVDGVVCT
jgi:hypothetical protein